jgi:hypothetical protein
MTSDGLYLDEMFSDVRLMNNPQAGGVGILGGECFGGTFGRSAKDGNYYFQGGGIAYRIYRIDGLKDTRRQTGEITVTPEQSAAAERRQTRLVAQETTAKSAAITAMDPAPEVDGKKDDWKLAPSVQWDRNGKFPVTVRAGHDARRLYLHFDVGDDSPWVNHGQDWQALFKSGDGIDLQLGTSASASPKRANPAPGDLRLFVAPMGSENVAVLYRHRMPEAPPAEAVIFQSPWRSEKVDSVKRLAAAVIRVNRERNRYQVEVAVPWEELGMTKAPGGPLQGDFGVIYGDAGGTVNVYRNYWSNQATGLVNDVPGEIMLSPNLWGELRFAEAEKATAAPK